VLLQALKNKTVQAIGWLVRNTKKQQKSTRSFPKVADLGGEEVGGSEDLGWDSCITFNKCDLGQFIFSEPSFTYL
jgi:hypothetical protein